MRKLFAVCALALTLAGCITVGQPIINPVTSVDMFRVKNVYAATLELVVAWRDYCWKRPYAVLMSDPVAKPVCQNRRQRLRTIQTAQVQAGTAVRYADNWVRQNPTISPASVIGPAWDAVTNFQQLVPRVN